MAFKEKGRKELQRLSLGLLQHFETGEVRNKQHRRLVMLDCPGRRKTESVSGGKEELAMSNAATRLSKMKTEN